MTARKLATVETITSVTPIPGADAIEAVRVRGWDVVVKKDELYRAGDVCVYIEIDSFLDTTNPVFSYLAARGVRTDATGRLGHVVKTARFRGQYSQGLVFRVTEWPELCEGWVVGDDVTETLSLSKWDPPEPANLSGEVKGVRPSWIPKTDEERVQNVPEMLTATARFEATEKVDGSSATFYFDAREEVFGVCSRNLELKDVPGNTLWELARRYDVEQLLRGTPLGERVALQGEVFGEGIQKNPLRIRGQRFLAFNLLVDGVRVARSAWPLWLKDLSVPVYADFSFPESIEQALAQVERLDSLVTPGQKAEGVVWRSVDESDVDVIVSSTGEEPIFMRRSGSFKVISNRYLQKHDR